MDLSSKAAASAIHALAARSGAADVVVHAACCKPGQGGTEDYVRGNVLTATYLAAALEKCPPRRLICISTLSVYGEPESNPVAETAVSRCTHPYPTTKLAGEMALGVLRENVQITVLRLPSLFGRGQADSFVDGLAKLALSDRRIELFGEGKQARDALHVEEAVGAIKACVDHPPREQYTVLNLGRGERIEAGRYARLLVELTGSKSEIVPSPARSNQPYDLFADIARARQMIDFHPASLPSCLAGYIHEIRG